MGKLEVIDGKMTTWEGLWWHPEINAYTSAAISLSELRKFKGKVRIQIRKNMYYEKGGNRPNYNFPIRDANSDVFATPEIREDGIAALSKKVEELREVMEQGNRNADKPQLPSESIAQAEWLEKRAIELIEELTGTEWNFTAWTWG